MIFSREGISQLHPCGLASPDWKNPVTMNITAFRRKTTSREIILASQCNYRTLDALNLLSSMQYRI